MDRYKLIKEVGDGTFGNVWRAINKQTNEVVAVKKMKRKYYSWEECMNLREVKSLRRMNHPNIVKLKEVIRENDILYFVMEYMDCNLYQLMKDRPKAFGEVEVRNWCFQIFQALAYMHQRGYFHRDLKPENLLVSRNIIKIADFGLAREISSNPPYTEYVSTRWYRAPEVLLQASVYDAAVDMWAMGAIMAELLTLRPLFPGSSEADEILKICNVIGTPNEDSWAAGLHLAETMKYHFPQVNAGDLSQLIPSVSQDAVDLISLLCSWDPSKRPTAAEALQHPFFKQCVYVAPSLRPRAAGIPRTPLNGGMKECLEQASGRRYSTGSSPATKSLNSWNGTTGLAKTGVNRKLVTDRQVPQKSMKVAESRHRIPEHAPLRTNQAYCVGSSRNSQPNRETANKVSVIGEKMSQLSLDSSSSPQQQQQLAGKRARPVLKAGHNRSDFQTKSSELVTPGRRPARKVMG